VGGAFLIVMRQAVQSCAALNRQPNASCTPGDNTLFAAPGIAVLVLGLLLTAYTVVRAQSSRSPSATPLS